MKQLKLRKETEKLVQYILYDYPKLDDYVNREVNFIKNPYAEYDGEPIVLIRSITLIGRCKEQKEVIDSLLERSPEWVQELIHYMYFSKERCKVTEASEIVGYDRRTGQKYHKAFLYQLAIELGMWTG